jgi:2,4-dienoyl-CoA reductase-like NADH-dependent reductase (Old Yellow Enzyme family)
MQDIYSTLSIINAFLTIAGIIGGYWAFKTGMNRTASEIQEHVINAMEQEITVLRARLEDLETENKRLDQVLYTLCEALKKRGLVVTIEGSMVTVSDGHETQSVRIQGV